MAMAFQIIASSSSSSSSPTITKSQLLSFTPLRSSYKPWKPNLSSWFSLLGSSAYIGLKHMGISITPKSSNPGKKRRCKGVTIRASLFGVGAPEALIIGVVALLVFGPKGLVEVARNLGKTLCAFQPTIRELQDVSRDFKSTLEREIGLDEITTPNMYNPNRMNPNDAQSPKAYTTEDYLKITQEQLKASSPGESQTESQPQTQEPVQPKNVQIPSGESQPNARETTATAPPRQD